MPEIDPVGNPKYIYVQVANAIAAHIQAGQITGRLAAERDPAAQIGRTR